MAELIKQYEQILEGEEPTVDKFAYQLAYNLIPQVDVFTENGYTKEEMKMYHETRKIMHSDIEVSATCVRVPRPVWPQSAQLTAAKQAMEPVDAFTVLSFAPGAVFFRPPLQGFVSVGGLYPG